MSREIEIGKEESLKVWTREIYRIALPKQISKFGAFVDRLGGRIDNNFKIKSYKGGKIKWIEIHTRLRAH